MIYHLLYETDTRIIQLSYSLFSEKYYKYNGAHISVCHIWQHCFSLCQNLNLISIYEIKNINWGKYE